MQYHASTGYDWAQLPRWINLDDLSVKDTWTGTLIRLTCDPGWDMKQCNQHAMKVVEALNRIYHA